MTLHFEGTPKTCAACRRELGLWCSDCVEAYGQDAADNARASQREACAIIVDTTDIVQAAGTFYIELGDARATLRAASAAIRAGGLTPANRCTHCGVNPVGPKPRIRGVKICSECEAFLEGGF